MDKNTTFKYWLAVARHTSYKIGKQPRPAFVGEKQVPDNLNQLSIGQLIDLSQLSDSEESLYQIVTTVLGLSHGMLDWYAVRMGISDHDQVLKTPWLRIYKCMEMDYKRSLYERNLQKLQAEEMKRKSR